MKTYVILLSLLSLNLAACDGAVRNYVRNENPPSTNPTRQPDAVPEGPQQVSLSAGSVDAGTTGMRLKARMGTTERSFSMGSDRKATLSIGRTRVN